MVLSKPNFDPLLKLLLILKLVWPYHSLEKVSSESKNRDTPSVLCMQTAETKMHHVFESWRKIYRSLTVNLEKVQMKYSAHTWYYKKGLCEFSFVLKLYSNQPTSSKDITLWKSRTCIWIFEGTFGLGVMNTSSKQFSCALCCVL